MPELMSQAAYARRRGVDPTSVRDALKAGRIKLVDGKIDAEQADIDWVQNSKVRSRQGGGGGHGAPHPPPSDTPIEAEGAPNYFEERARRERALADQAEMEAAKMRGELVSAEDVARQWSVEASRQREAWLQFAERIAPLLEMRPLAFIRQTVDAEVRQILSGLSA